LANREARVSAPSGEDLSGKFNGRLAEPPIDFALIPPHKISGRHFVPPTDSSVKNRKV
jgi:hypothetical protein